MLMFPSVVDDFVGHHLGPSWVVLEGRFSPRAKMLIFPSVFDGFGGVEANGVCADLAKMLIFPRVFDGF